MNPRIGVRNRTQNSRTAHFLSLLFFFGDSLPDDTLPVVLSSAIAQNYVKTRTTRDKETTVVKRPITVDMVDSFAGLYNPATFVISPIQSQCCSRRSSFFTLFCRWCFSSDGLRRSDIKTMYCYCLASFSMLGAELVTRSSSSCPSYSTISWAVQFMALPRN